MRKVVCAAALAFGCATVAPALAADLGMRTKAPPAPVVVSPWDIGFGAAVMSDYNFRGITQSNHKPAVSAYFEPRYNFTDSLQGYVGVGGASISFPNRAAAEVDFYGGIRPTFGKLALDFGVWDYYYPGGQCFNDPVFGGDCAGALPNTNTVKADLSFWELYGKATYTLTDQFSFGGSVYWSPSVLNSGADGTYIAGTAKYVLPTLPYDIGWFVSGDVGHWFLGTSDAFYGNVDYKDYTAWDAGVGFTWKQFTLDLRYFDSDLDKVNCALFSGDHTATGNPLESSWCGARFIAKLSVDLTSANLK